MDRSSPVVSLVVVVVVVVVVFAAIARQDLF